jgi:hypothetical protein
MIIKTSNADITKSIEFREAAGHMMQEIRNKSMDIGAPTIKTSEALHIISTYMYPNGVTETQIEPEFTLPENLEPLANALPDICDKAKKFRPYIGLIPLSLLLWRLWRERN